MGIHSSALKRSLVRRLLRERDLTEQEVKPAHEVTTYNSQTMQQWPEEVSAKPQRGWWTAVFRDVQFWVPMIVLLIGLLLLWMAR
jgi:hypothetical protein